MKRILFAMVVLGAAALTWAARAETAADALKKPLPPVFDPAAIDQSIRPFHARASAYAPAITAAAAVTWFMKDAPPITKNGDTATSNASRRASSFLSGNSSCVSRVAKNGPNGASNVKVARTPPKIPKSSA